MVAALSGQPVYKVVTATRAQASNLSREAQRIGQSAVPIPQADGIAVTFTHRRVDSRKHDHLLVPADQLHDELLSAYQGVPVGQDVRVRPNLAVRQRLALLDRTDDRDDWDRPEWFFDRAGLRQAMARHRLGTRIPERGRDKDTVVVDIASRVAVIVGEYDQQRGHWLEAA